MTDTIATTEATKAEAKQTAKPKAEKKAHTLPTDVLTKGLEFITAYVESFLYAIGQEGLGRVVRFKAIRALYEVWPTATTEELSKYLADGPMSKVPAEFRRQSTSELSPCLLMVRHLANHEADLEKVQGGWEGVEKVLSARGWNATVSELRKVGALPDAEKRASRKARIAANKTETAGPAGTHSIPMDDPAEAVRLVTIWLQRFRTNNLNGVEKVSANPVLARSFQTLCKLASDELRRISEMLDTATKEKKIAA